MPDDAPTFRVERRPFQHRVTAEGTLEAASTTTLSVPSEVQRSVRLAWLAPEGSVVDEGEVVARFDPAEMRERLIEGEADLRSAGLEVHKSKVESGSKVKELDTQLQIADLELDHVERFQKTDVEVFSKQEVVESQVDGELARERKSHASESRQARESLSRTELDLLAIKQRQAQLTIDQANDGLSALEVRAPHAGILTLERNWQGEVLQVGAEMWRSQQIAEIPDLSTMEAEVFVLEADAGGLEAGKPASVIIEARPGAVHSAKIRRVDAVAKPRFRGSPVQYFGVSLTLDSAAEIPKKPGQRVRATLFLHDLDDVLVVPRQAVVQEGGQARVYVREGGKLEPRRVETGASSLGLVVVTEGLSEGDEIALSPPYAGGETEDESVGAAPSLAVGAIQ
ncbi:MAG: HlyD family efflux transporter periplasmic adaptor subunit [Acidobacteriota bacterium]